jgi:hypothetical protein
MDRTNSLLSSLTFSYIAGYSELTLFRQQNFVFVGYMLNATRKFMRILYITEEKDPGWVGYSFFEDYEFNGNKIWQSNLFSSLENQDCQELLIIQANFQTNPTYCNKIIHEKLFRRRTPSVSSFGQPYSRESGRRWPFPAAFDWKGTGYRVVLPGCFRLGSLVVPKDLPM